VASKLTGVKLADNLSGLSLGYPISQPDKLLHLATFIAVFLSFYRAISSGPEGMFGADRFGDEVDRFGHTTVPFLFEFSKQANVSSLPRPEGRSLRCFYISDETALGKLKFKVFPAVHMGEISGSGR
jgi:hypothetical protein